MYHTVECAPLTISYQLFFSVSLKFGAYYVTGQQGEFRVKEGSSPYLSTCKYSPFGYDIYRAGVLKNAVLFKNNFIYINKVLRLRVL